MYENVYVLYLNVCIGAETAIQLMFLFPICPLYMLCLGQEKQYTCFC